MKATFEKINPSQGRSFKVMHNVGHGFLFNWHFHPEFELTYIVRGKGQRHVGDHYAEFKPGDLILVGPHLPHTWDMPMGKCICAEAIVIQFDLNCFGEGFFVDLEEMQGIYRLLQKAQRGIWFHHEASQIALEYLAELPKEQGASALIGLLKTLDELTQIPVDAMEVLASKTYRPVLRKQDEDRIDRICHWMHEHYAEQVTHEQAARITHMTGSAFSRYFKKQMGRTFIDYLNEIRITEACRRLIETDDSITSICFAVGYGNQANFNRRFMAIKQTTPSSFRKAYRKT